MPRWPLLIAAAIPIAAPAQQPPVPAAVPPPAEAQTDESGVRRAGGDRPGHARTARRGGRRHPAGSAAGAGGHPLLWRQLGRRAAGRAQPADAVGTRIGRRAGRAVERATHRGLPGNRRTAHRSDRAGRYSARGGGAQIRLSRRPARGELRAAPALSARPRSRRPTGSRRGATATSRPPTSIGCRSGATGASTCTAPIRRATRCSNRSVMWCRRAVWAARATSISRRTGRCWAARAPSPPMRPMRAIWGGSARR